MVSIMYSQPLILGAQEDGADEIASNEEKQETIVKMWVPVGVKDAQQDQACGACYATSNAEAGKDFLRRMRIGREAACVTQPALGNEGQNEENGCDAIASDK